MSFTDYFYCVIDRSGSMSEYGKPMLMINLLRFIRQFALYNLTDAKYLIWSKKLEPINWNKTDDVKLPKTDGGADISLLCDWCEKHVEKIFLVLTDGYFEISNEQRQRLLNLDNIFFIAVGGDANTSNIATFSENTYIADQIEDVLSTITRFKAPTEPPLERVIFLNTNTKKETEDEW